MKQRVRGYNPPFAVTVHLLLAIGLLCAFVVSAVGLGAVISGSGRVVLTRAALAWHPGGIGEADR